ncbi:MULTISPECIES: RNA polymerase sporulation sigma factor SigH [Peptostreptococcus]|jgi:RNA polymerase sporulation-specific sigma factor|uniref:RNA polymerase sigma factor SigS n=3 Tax=Peptostreptococcus TaxID=1257 RepID=A0A135YUH9_9FIRM|nr:MULTISPECIES: RNA polymerase sporulation sigma factor SigH [Peptostreptococcus]KXB73787.1 RNA polymerase sigma-H factor [Peptostreptococcus anaerobius]KXI13069.1 RNA polymerase sigma-H factor [Peptostreptococcus anaerobius]MBS5596304.1 RNA polymerase sporulation sigma factor SigH [Peptostreptococcus sp.]MDB8850783.1 RNA polymerase sporulation sigma factor SigH [Peptostreptococcus anaerobius]MDB8851810.1 RNA polymerase sporulation sigma factor SigH [Peptostreptococcus anaerobius]
MQEEIEDQHPNCHEQDLDYELVDMAKQGDKYAINKLIEKYSIMVKAKAKTYFLVGADKEDIIQEGLIGLYKAIRDYDEDKTCSFRYFADICVTRQIITAIKTATRQKHIPLNTYISLNRPMFEEESERTLYDMVTTSLDNDPEGLVIDKEAYKDMENRMKKTLSKFEEEVFIRYLSGQSYSDIAISLSKDAKSVDNAIQRVKKKLEKNLSEYSEVVL